MNASGPDRPGFVEFAARVDARGFDVSFALGAGERLAVLGPNGAGKSTLLSVLAGTLRPDRGRGTLDGRVLFDLGTRGGSSRWLPPHRRRVALLAQDPLLFPNLSALDNVAFGPRAARIPRTQARGIAQRWLDEVDAGGLAGRRPDQLSGGQAQRVAVARAVATDPRLLLLDEPLAALDVAAAPMLRRVLRTVLADRAVVVVTHDLLDAVLLTDRVIVLDHGRVVESGSTLEVLRHPTSAFTARLAGLNFVAGTGVGADRTTGSGAAVVAVQPSPPGPPLFGTPRTPIAAGEPAVAVFAPTAVSVHLEAPHGSPRNQLEMIITELEPRGDQIAVRAEPVTGGSVTVKPGSSAMTALVTPAALGELDLYPGRTVWYSIKATAVTLYPR